LETLLSLLQYQRDSLIRKLDGVDGTAADPRDSPSESPGPGWLIENAQRTMKNDA
jgi:hypothetical protein